MIDSKEPFVMNIEPLFDEMYTGVAFYTLNVFLESVKDTQQEWRYVAFDKEILLPETLPLLSNKEPLSKFKSLLQKDLDKNVKDSKCLYFRPREKYQIYREEFEVVHDLGIMLVPQWHDVSTVNLESQKITNSISSNTHTFCVSDSTKQHLKIYCGLKEQNVTNVGCGPMLQNLVADRNADLCARKKVTILGTVEPRKNLRVLFKLFYEHPWLLNLYDFCFVGGYGWGDSLEDIAFDEGLDLRSLKRVIHITGYVTEAEKIEHINTSRFTIYPSFFEGFGMPVLESLSLGIPVVCSNTTSLPEVGGEAAYYFDPFNHNSLIEALKRLELDLLEHSDKVIQKNILQSQTFSWQLTYKKLRAGMAR